MSEVADFLIRALVFITSDLEDNTHPSRYNTVAKKIIAIAEALAEVTIEESDTKG